MAVKYELSTDFADLCKTVESYYGSGSEPYQKLVQYGWTPAEFERYAPAAGINVTYSANKKRVLSYESPIVRGKITTYEEDVYGGLSGGTAAVDNTVAFSTVADTTAEAADKAVTSGKITKFTNGVKGVLNNPVIGKVGSAVTAASVGISLGKTIDGAIYDIGKALGQEDKVWMFDPDVFNNITSGENGLATSAFNWIFGINPDGSAEPYMDEDALAYMARWLAHNKIFEQGTESNEAIDVGGKHIPAGALKRTPFVAAPWTFKGTGDYEHKGVGTAIGTNAANGPVYTTEMTNGVQYWLSGYTRPTTPTLTKEVYIVSKNNYGHVAQIGYFPTGSVWGSSSKLSARKITYNGDTFYSSGNLVGITANPFYQKSTVDLNDNAVLWALLFGKFVTQSAVSGVSDTDNAKVADPSDWTDQAATLTSLKKQYPELWDNRVENKVVQPDGSTRTVVYVPVHLPTGGTATAPSTTGLVQDTTKVSPSSKTATDSQIATAIKTITDSLTKPQEQTSTETAQQPIPLNPTTNPNPTGTGTGDTPPVTPQTGTAASLYAIYNPTLDQINQFGSWLWSSNFVDQLLKLFNDPMQAIIGLHKVYATPAVGGTRNIKVGYLDSGVSSNYVSDQYTTVDCGTVSCAEYFGNVFDYAPYTSIQLYLPFIGIVGLDVADVMRSKIHVVYHVDVLTGACLADVRVSRGGGGGTLYQYAGNAAVTIPISSGSYMGIVASLASIAGGVAGTLASGGAAAPMLLGAAGSALNARTRVEHSGSFSGNAGAMGSKKPYLIISRPETALASNYKHYIGNPANKTVELGTCSGYIKVTECHLENIPATQAELSQIEQELKGGVLI